MYYNKKVPTVSSWFLVWIRVIGQFWMMLQWFTGLSMASYNRGERILIKTMFEPKQFYVYVSQAVCTN